ncbi:Uncharacterised protein [Neisseria meningitidis]|nr:Uncharacterised protein [Neisseria meningitidis]
MSDKCGSGGYYRGFGANAVKKEQYGCLPTFGKTSEIRAARACRFDYFGVGGIHCFDREDGARQTAARGTKTAAAVLGRQRRSDGILGAGGGAAGRLAGGRAGAFGYGAGRDCPNHGKIWRRSRFAEFACRPVGSCFGRRRRRRARSAVFYRRRRRAQSGRFGKERRHMAAVGF